MAGSSPLFYWDSCLFLAWLKDEERPSGEMDGVRETIARARRREVRIMTSVLTMVEVLAARLPAGMDTLFQNALKRVNRAAMDIRVAQIAHDLRNHYAGLGNKTLSSPDAIHLATAILYRADEFHTFDGQGSSRSLGLLPLSGNVGGNKLVICRPVARNPQLDLRKPSARNLDL